MRPGALSICLLLAVALAAPAAAPATTVSLGSCGWLLRTDPVLVNVLYPDEDATYWTARLPVPPPGVSYRIRGEFPHARYMSFVAYDGLPIDALLDAHIPAHEGSANPFVPGASRDAERRSYTVKIVGTPAPSDPSEREPGALYVSGGQLGLPGAVFYMIYRVYVPDRGLAAAGGVGLPSIEVVTPGDAEPVDLRGLDCESLRGSIATAPPAAAHEALAGTSPPAGIPALQARSTPTWTVESGLTAGLLGRAGQGELVSGGPASNPHNRYIAALVSRAHGPVIAIRGKAPSTPPTIDGEPVMSTGDLRYWSFCQNGRSTRFVDCLSESHMQLDGDGWYTIAISAPADHPASAQNWLAFGPEPESQVLYRHMLPSAEFLPHSAHGAAESGLPLEEAMGDYYPRIAYCTAAQFDTDACGLAR